MSTSQSIKSGVVHLNKVLRLFCTDLLIMLSFMLSLCWWLWSEFSKTIWFDIFSERYNKELSTWPKQIPAYWKSRCRVYIPTHLPNNMPIYLPLLRNHQRDLWTLRHLIRVTTWLHQLIHWGGVNWAHIFLTQSLAGLSHLPSFSKLVFAWIWVFTISCVFFKWWFCSNFSTNNSLTVAQNKCIANDSF